MARQIVLYPFRSCPYRLATRRAIGRLNIDVSLRDIHLDTSAYDELVAGGGCQTAPGEPGFMGWAISFVICNSV